MMIYNNESNLKLNTMGKTLQQLRIDVFDAFETKIPNGDIYINHVPKKEKGLQYELYLYLKERGYDVVYELELHDLGQYVTSDINEGKTNSSEDKTFSHEEGSLVPDIVVNLGDEGFACYELKYNETRKSLYDHDGDKCKVYVEHCSDVHYAGFINLLKGAIDGYRANACKDPNYKFHYCFWNDKYIDKEKALSKANNAYPIREIWEEKNEAIKQGRGEFSDLEGTNYMSKIK